MGKITGQFSWPYSKEVPFFMKEKVQTALEKIRPALQADGGDVTLVDVTEDGTVKVKLTGACGSCPMSTMTLKNGIERLLKQEIPEVKEVIQE
jgi:Fe-S cluster biogenesis protein NfuA